MVANEETKDVKPRFILLDAHHNLHEAGWCHLVLWRGLGARCAQEEGRASRRADEELHSALCTGVGPFGLWSDDGLPSDQPAGKGRRQAQERERIEAGFSRRPPRPRAVSLRS